MVYVVYHFTIMYTNNQIVSRLNYHFTIFYPSINFESSSFDFIIGEGSLFNMMSLEMVLAFQNNIPKKQSFDTIIHTNDLNISTSTAYRYIRDHQIPGIANIDLKRQVRYTQRSSSRHHPISIDYDFLAALETAGPDVNVWEMDTIIGKKESNEKCVLTLLHRRSNLQLYFLLRNKNMFEVTYLFDTIKTFLGIELFREMFTMILTDNGTEFHDPLSLETDPETGEKLISIYFARPRRSDDKANTRRTMNI